MKHYCNGTFGTVRDRSADSSRNSIDVRARRAFRTNYWSAGNAMHATRNGECMTFLPTELRSLFKATCPKLLVRRNP